MPRWRQLGLLTAVLAGAAAQDTGVGAQGTATDDDLSAALAMMKDDFKGMSKERYFIKTLDKKYHHLIGDLRKEASDSYKKQLEEKDGKLNSPKPADTDKEIGEVDTDTDSASSFLETAPTPLPVGKAAHAMRDFLAKMQHRAEHYREDRKEAEATIEKDAKAREAQQQMALQKQRDAANSVGVAVHPSSFLEEDGWESQSHWKEYEAVMDSLDSKFKREAVRYDNMAKADAIEQAAEERTATEPSSLIQTDSEEPDDSEALERTGYMDLRRVNDQLSKLQQRMKTEAAEAERESYGAARGPQPDTPAPTEDGAAIGVGDADATSFLEFPRGLNKKELADLKHFRSSMEAVRQSFHKKEEKIIGGKPGASEDKWPRLDSGEDEDQHPPTPVVEKKEANVVMQVAEATNAVAFGKAGHAASKKTRRARKSSRRMRHKAKARRDAESSFLEAGYHKKTKHKTKGKHAAQKDTKTYTVPARIKNSPELKPFKEKVKLAKIAEGSVKAEEKKAEADEKKQQAKMIKSEAERKHAESKADATKSGAELHHEQDTFAAERGKVFEKTKQKMHKLEEKLRAFKRHLPKGPEDLPKLKAFKGDWAARLAKRRQQMKALGGLPSGSSMLQLAQDATEELAVVQRKVQARRAQREQQLAAYFRTVRGPAPPSSFAEVGQPRMVDQVSEDLLTSWAQNIHQTELNFKDQEEGFFKRLGMPAAAPSSLLEAGNGYVPPFDPSKLDDTASDDFPNADAAGVAAFEERYKRWAARDREQASADVAQQAQLSQQLGRAMDMGKLRAALGEEPSSWLQRRARSEQLRTAGAA